MPFVETDASKWPFEAWLKLAQSRFGWSPETFWETGLRDWRTLIRPVKSQTLTRAEFETLHTTFPDTETL